MTQRVEDLFDFMAVDDGTRGKWKEIHLMLWPNLRGFLVSRQKHLEAFVDAVAVDIEGLHSTADLGRLFEHHDFLPGPLQGSCGGQAGEAGPDHHDRHRSDALRRA